jgi:3-oxoacyl-[acyl-carrier-protein] synthase-3
VTGLRARIVGCGAALPQRQVSNQDLARTVDTSDEWIVQRTGITTRYIAGEGETTSTLALDASRRAVAAAGMGPDDLDLVILATTTPDRSFPATAVRVQAGLGMTRGAAFDVQAVCAGFVFALAIADSFIRGGQARRALVIGAETFSRLLDWDDRSTCVLFGDGAGAVVLDAVSGDGSPRSPGILSCHLHSDGRQEDKLYVDGGISTTGTVGHVRMNGREVFKQAVVHLADVVDEALAANGLRASDIDWLVPHQANRRIIDATARKLGLPSERVVQTVDRHANTSAASIPLALDVAVGDGRIKPGDLVLIEAIGGGLAWGSALIRW